MATLVEAIEAEDNEIQFRLGLYDHVMTEYDLEARLGRPTARRLKEFLEVRWPAQRIFEFSEIWCGFSGDKP